MTIHTTALGVCVAVASVLACVLTAVSWTAIARLQTYDIDRFESESLPVPDTLRNKRGDAVSKAGLYQFHTSQYQIDKSMFLYPTPGDVIQLLGSKAHGVDKVSGKQDDTLEAVSRGDSRFPRGDVKGACSSRVADATPKGSGVCLVRVFDATYEITKTCMRLSILKSIAAVAGSRDNMKLVLNSSMPSTAFIVLMRPMFMSFYGSSTYKVDLLPKGNTSNTSNTSNTMSHFDSSVDTPLTVYLSRVQDEVVSKPVDEKHDRYLTNGLGRGAEDSTAVNLFFMRFTGQTFQLEAKDQNSGRVLALYIQLPEDLSDGVELASLAGHDASISISVQVSSASTPCLVVTIIKYSQSATYEIDVLPSSFIIATLCDTLLNVAVMTRDHTCYKSFVMETVFHTSEYGGTANILAHLAASQGLVPVGLKPYTNTSVPDMADIALRLRHYPIKTFRRQ